MSEEIKRKGRQPGVSYKKDTGYITVNDKLRIRIETDNLTVEEYMGKNEEGEIWGNNKYFTSWKGVFDWLIRRFTTDRISKKEKWTFIEGKNEIISAINNVKDILLGEIDSAMRSGSEEIKNSIRKFNR